MVFLIIFPTHEQIAYVVDFGKSVCFIAKHKTNRRADEVMFKCHGFEAESPDKVSEISHCPSYTLTDGRVQAKELARFIALTANQVFKKVSRRLYINGVGRRV